MYYKKYTCVEKEKRTIKNEKPRENWRKKQRNWIKNVKKNKENSENPIKSTEK